MVTQVNRVEQPRDFYVNLARKSDEILQRGLILGREVKIFVTNQYNILKRHDKELFPLALLAGSVGMLFASNVLLLVGSFAAGALFRVANGEAWKEGIITIAKEAWQGSNLGKIACVAFLVLFAAPLKWGLAAFGLGIYVVHVLQQQQPPTAAIPPVEQPEVPPQLVQLEQQLGQQPALQPAMPLVQQQPRLLQQPGLQQLQGLPPEIMGQIGALMQALQRNQALNP